MDEKEGPYKVVGKIVGPRESQKYMIVKQERHDAFQREVIPDAGLAETARLVCNLLNKYYKQMEADMAQIRGEYDEAGRPDGGGNDGKDV